MSDSDVVRENVRRAVTTPGQNGIFISYRRSDEAGVAGRIYDRFVAEFGANQVFMDVGSIGLGRDFVQVLQESLAKCVAQVVVIGERWLSAFDEDGQRRLDDPDDFVRMEIEAALGRDILVIPLFVERAQMPRRTDLPEALQPLCRRNGRAISNANFKNDCVIVIDTLKQVLIDERGGAQKPEAPPTPPQQQPQRIWDERAAYLQLVDEVERDPAAFIFKQKFLNYPLNIPGRTSSGVWDSSHPPPARPIGQYKNADEYASAVVKEMKKILPHAEVRGPRRDQDEFASSAELMFGSTSIDVRIFYPDDYSRYSPTRREVKPLTPGASVILVSTLESKKVIHDFRSPTRHWVTWHGPEDNEALTDALMNIQQENEPT